MFQVEVVVLIAWLTWRLVCWSHFGSGWRAPSVRGEASEEA